MVTSVKERADTLEECYEFMLAYAARGLPGEAGSAPDGRIREFLQRALSALDGLTESARAAVQEQRREAVEKYEAFFEVLDRDARDSLAGLDLVLAQPAIGSQMIDNLNGSIHLRALLTDLFLIGDILRPPR